jgi:tetratricopeptide (TPR) repeat protein
MRSAWPFAAAAVPCLVWTKMVQMVPPFVGVLPRPLLALDALAFYLRKLVWPAKLAVDYEHSPRVVMRGSAWLVTWVAPAAVAAILWAGRNKRPTLVAAGVIFVAALLPLLGLTPFMYQVYSTTADHYLYLPMLGVALAAAWVMTRWPTRGVTTAVGIVIAALAIRSAVQAGVWEDDVTLNSHAAAVTPNSFAAHANLAAALEFQAVRDNDRAKLDEAIRHLRLAIAANPDAFLSYNNLGSILYRQGKTDEAFEMLKEGLAAAERAPRPDVTQLAEAHVSFGLLLQKQDRHDAAAAEFRRALELKPGYEPAIKALGQQATSRPADG